MTYAVSTTFDCPSCGQPVSTSALSSEIKDDGYAVVATTTCPYCSEDIAYSADLTVTDD